MLQTTIELAAQVCSIQISEKKKIYNPSSYVSNDNNNDDISRSIKDLSVIANLATIQKIRYGKV